MKIYYQGLPRPKYVFADGQRFSSAFQGLRTAGPFHMGECPIEPRVLFVYPKELREEARKLYFSLKDGIGPFKGTESLLGFHLLAKNIIRLDSFSVAGKSDGEAAAEYHNAINLFLEESAVEADLALIIHRETDRSSQDNPYLVSKFPLLKRNIPTQVVTTGLLNRTEQFQWSAGNIALAVFAKMGGRPWAVDTGLTDDSIIVGINRTSVRSGNNGVSRRYYGFASTFSHNGLYLGTKLFPPADNWDAYLEGLEEALDTAIGEWRNQVGTPVNLVLHVKKEIAKEETKIIERCLGKATGNLVRAYAILRLGTSEHMLLLDPGDKDTMIPPSGIMVHLAGHRALLQIAGYDPKDQSVGKKLNSGPWHIAKLYASTSAPSFNDLCNHVMALAAMNWRGLNAEASPVSIQFPHLVADLLGRFDLAGFDVASLQGIAVMERPWFL